MRAMRTPLGGPPQGVARRVRPRELLGRCGGDAQAGERHRRKSAARAQRSSVAESAEDPAKRWIPEAEVKRLRKTIRTSFRNSPHKKKYWTALLDMYSKAEPEHVHIGRAAPAVNPLPNMGFPTGCPFSP